MTAPTTSIEDAQEILFKKSTRAKRLNVRIAPFEKIRVSVPVGVSMKQAQAFVASKAEWIARHHAEARALEALRLSHSDRIGRLDPSAAVAILQNRLRELACRHGFQYKKIGVRKQKTRWGSCSVDNCISLNVRLALLPDELMDYVIIHELVHTRVKNHGATFWQELERLLNDARALDRRLKDYSYLLF